MECTVGELNVGCRRKKREKHPLNAAAREGRYSDPDPSLKKLKEMGRPCTHDTKNFQCKQVSWSDISKNRRNVYQYREKAKQDVSIMRLMSAYDPVRNRPGQSKDSNFTKPKQITTKFYFQIKGKKLKEKMIPVCKGFFCYALGISKKRVLNIGKCIHNGQVPNDKRGGDRKSLKKAGERTSVMDFIKKLPCTESHYGRGKSKRVYLSPELSIAKLHKFYNEAHPNCKVSFSFFYRIFVHDFNIGFSSPATDACATCTRLKYELQCAKNEDQRIKRTELRVHKLRANSFYEIMKEAQSLENAKVIIFDLQQVHPLPKTPIGDAFYTRQIAFYTFCCVSPHSRDPTFYTWTETQSGRGAVEIGSALLCHLQDQDFTGIDTIFLFCDGCGGQNKNAHIIHVLSYWLKKFSPNNIKSIKITFPVRGHSFLPADRAFGRIEKILKKLPQIKNSEEYEESYRQVGMVKRVGVEWNVYPIKQLATFYNKITGISQAKKIEIKKFATRVGGISTRVRCVSHYRFESKFEVFRSILKKGKNEDDLPELAPQPLIHPVTAEKKKDVLHLLKTHYGENWIDDPGLSWFKPIIFGDSSDHTMEANEDHEINSECDCLDEEDIDMHV